MSCHACDTHSAYDGASHERRVERSPSEQLMRVEYIGTQPALHVIKDVAAQLAQPDVSTAEKLSPAILGTDLPDVPDRILRSEFIADRHQMTIGSENHDADERRRKAILEIRFQCVRI